MNVTYICFMAFEQSYTIGTGKCSPTQTTQSAIVIKLHTKYSKKQQVTYDLGVLSDNGKTDIDVVWPVVKK